MSPPREPRIIGIAGGIGSGKSTVAREFVRRGFVLIDYDALARAALDRPNIQRTLVEWWGSGILADGKTDRAAIARIVFADEAERQRLERLIHPAIVVSHAQAMELARAADGGPAPGVIVDAPLLFEAGLDKECDATVFVDAPRDLRLERVRETRGWDEAEFDRREAAQWPLDRKRAGCAFVIHNGGKEPDFSSLGRQVEQVCATLG